MRTIPGLAVLAAVSGVLAAAAPARAQEPATGPVVDSIVVLGNRRNTAEAIANAGSLAAHTAVVAGAIGHPGGVVDFHGIAVLIQNPTPAHVHVGQLAVNFTGRASDIAGKRQDALFGFCQHVRLLQIQVIIGLAVGFQFGMRSDVLVHGLLWNLEDFGIHPGQLLAKIHGQHLALLFAAGPVFHRQIHIGVEVDIGPDALEFLPGIFRDLVIFDQALGRIDRFVSGESAFEGSQLIQQAF